MVPAGEAGVLGRGRWVHVLGQEAEAEFNDVLKRPVETGHNFDSKGTKN